MGDKEKDLTDLISAEKLKEPETRKLLDNAFRDGELRISGTAVDKIMPPMSRFGSGAVNRIAKKEGLIEKLKSFFE